MFKLVNYHSMKRHFVAKYIIVLILLMLISPAWAAEPFRIVLTDIDRDIHIENWKLNSSDLSVDTSEKGSDELSKCSVSKYTLHGGKKEGIDVIEVNNGKLQFTIIPTHGMSILNMQAGDFSPIPINQDTLGRLVHPEYLDKQELQNSPEGINEWIVRSGLKFLEKPSSADSIDTGSNLYGTIGITPASRVEVVVEREAPYSISIRGTIYQIDSDGARLELQSEISTGPGSNTFRISDTVTNHSSDEHEIDLLYRVNFSSQLVDKGARFFGPMQRIVPVNKSSASNAGNYYLYDREKIGSDEQIYCMVPWADMENRTEIMLHNSRGDKAISISYSAEELPLLTLWKKPLGSDGGYMTSLEPGTGFPFNKGIEKKLGQVAALAPGQSRSFKIDFSILTDQKQVGVAANQIAKIWAGRRTRIETGPQVGMNATLKDIVAAARTWGPSFTNWYGKPAPELMLTDINGKTHKLSDYRGKDVMVVLWATWCGPCRVEIPHLIELRKSVSEDKLAILAISNENPGLVKRFAEQTQMNYTILLDRGTMPPPYSSVTGIPSSFFIDPEGKIKLATTGLLSLEEIKAILQAE